MTAWAQSLIRISNYEVETLQKRLADINERRAVASHHDYVFLVRVRIGLREVALQLKLHQLLVVDDLDVRDVLGLEQGEAVLGVDGLRAGAGEQLEAGDRHDHQQHAPQPRGLPERLRAA